MGKQRYSYDPNVIQEQQRTLPRTTTNSDDETISEIEEQSNSNVLLPATTKPIESKTKISPKNIERSANEWCPIDWFKNRVYNKDADDFFKILPHSETDGVAKELLMYEGGATTLIKNVIDTLDTMRNITNYVQQQYDNGFNDKQTKKWLRDQKEVLTDYDSVSMHKDAQNGINKIENQQNKYCKNKNDYNLYEEQRKLIWKSLPNETTNIEQTQLQKNKKEEKSDDDDFEILNDSQNKKQKIERKKSEESYDDAMLFNEGKNPIYADTQPQRFWSKFLGYVEPINPNIITSILPHLQSDAGPVNIGPLPFEKSFVDNFDDMDCDENILTNKDNDLFFAEMPKNYEYFRSDDAFVIEEHKIEKNENCKYLRSDAVHQNYPNKSLQSHSFDQRTLSIIVHECNVMYNIEQDKDENYWNKIGKKNKNERDNEMIEPNIKYESNQSMDEDIKCQSFEGAIRRQICKYFFNDDQHQIDKIVSMPWQNRKDDECCAVIKSLHGALQQNCHENAPNDIETNVEIANEIIERLKEEKQCKEKEYDSYRQLSEHIALIEKNHIDSNAQFVVDQETLNMPQWNEYFKDKQQNICVEDAVKAFQPIKHIETTQKYKY